MNFSSTLDSFDIAEVVKSIRCQFSSPETHTCTIVHSAVANLTLIANRTLYPLYFLYSAVRLCLLRCKTTLSRKWALLRMRPHIYMWRSATGKLKSLIMCFTRICVAVLQTVFASWHLAPCAMYIASCIVILPDWIAWNMEKDETINDLGCRRQGGCATFFDKPLQPLQICFDTYFHTDVCLVPEIWGTVFYGFCWYLRLPQCVNVLLKPFYNQTNRFMFPPDTFLPQRYITMCGWPIGVSASFHH